jgi:hypothetical protein
MTADTQNTASQPQEQQQLSNKELNFRTLEAKYQRELAAERAEREKLAKALEERSKMQEEPEEENEDYVQKKKLDQKLAKFNQSTQSEIQKAMEFAKKAAKEEIKKEMWLEKNNDFYDIIKHADKLYAKDRELAESILEMPVGFEREKLVYQNIKALGLHKPEEKQPSIQEKIDSNKKSPYYQPSGVAAAPYAAASDFSESGQKQAYQKMQELKKRLRM